MIKSTSLDEAHKESLRLGLIFRQVMGVGRPLEAQLEAWEMEFVVI
jgi:hypothetical protein